MKKADNKMSAKARAIALHQAWLDADMSSAPTEVKEYDLLLKSIKDSLNNSKYTESLWDVIIQEMEGRYSKLWMRISPKDFRLLERMGIMHAIKACHKNLRILPYEEGVKLSPKRKGFSSWLHRNKDKHVFVRWMGQYGGRNISLLTQLDWELTQQEREVAAESLLIDAKKPYQFRYGLGSMRREAVGLIINPAAVKEAFRYDCYSLPDKESGNLKASRKHNQGYNHTEVFVSGADKYIGIVIKGEPVNLKVLKCFAKKHNLKVYTWSDFQALVDNPQQK